MDILDPRVIVDGHTHHGCRRVHRERILEVTLPSFNWRNKDNPSFLLVSVYLNYINFGSWRLFLMMFIYLTDGFDSWQLRSVQMLHASGIVCLEDLRIWCDLLFDLPHFQVETSKRFLHSQVSLKAFYFQNWISKNDLN